MKMDVAKDHWKNIYTKKDATKVSWFQEHAETSLKIINDFVGDKSSQLIDVGAGASTLVDDLTRSGYHNIDVLDISSEALDIARKRLGEKSRMVNWIQANILEVELPKHKYDVWHDRAVFHFLTDEQSRRKYIEQVFSALKPGGKVIISTFGPEGPLMCSGLPIVRYTHETLHEEFGAAFSLIKHGEEKHLTPDGSIQQFVYCYCRLLTA